MTSSSDILDDLRTLMGLEPDAVALPLFLLIVVPLLGFGWLWLFILEVQCIQAGLTPPDFYEPGWAKLVGFVCFVTTVVGVVGHFAGLLF